MKDPCLDIADNTYTRGRTTDINERRKFGRLRAYTSNTVGKHYLRMTMIEPRKTTEWKWAENLRVLGRVDTETHVGIRLHAGQVKQLRNFCDKWLKCHYEEGGAK